jgi:hypothetical protein
VVIEQVRLKRCSDPLHDDIVGQSAEPQNVFFQSEAPESALPRVPITAAIK